LAVLCILSQIHNCLNIPVFVAAKLKIKILKGVAAVADDISKGQLKQIKGKIKEDTGKVTGNKSKEIEGKAENAVGKVQEQIGKAKNNIKKAMD
jgi:uncharacterized protein YjbJ (UPF0337 family)